MGKPDHTYRNLQIFALTIDGQLSDDEIGARFGVSGRTVRNICRAISKKMAAKEARRVEGLRWLHTRRLEFMYSESVKGWNRSLEDAVTITTKTGESGPIEEKTVRGQSGNATHLKNAMQALEGIRAIWGANTPPALDSAGQVRMAGRTVEEVQAELRSRIAKVLGENQVN